MAKKSKSEFSFSDFVQELKDSSVSGPEEIDTLSEKKYYLIVCEGEKTEPLYFDYYQSILPNNTVALTVIGEGAETIRVVEKAIREKAIRDEDPLNPPFDFVWAIFDKDDFPDVNFNRAVDLATQNNIQAGYSNQAFELWYVLHFDYLDSQISRADYITRLSVILNSRYEKNDDEIPNRIRTEGNVRLAIRYAETLEQMFAGSTPAQSWPSTKVYELIKEFEDILDEHNA